MRIFSIEAKRRKREIKRKKERELKKRLYETAKGRALYKSRKAGNIIKRLISQGYTQKQAMARVSSIDHLIG